MTVLGVVLYYALTLFILLLVARIVLEWIQALSPSMRPSGAVVVVFEVVYTSTDPPVKLLRRWIPPLRIGGVALDLSILVLLIVAIIVRGQVTNL
jgi:YggT family protein